MSLPAFRFIAARIGKACCCRWRAWIETSLYASEGFQTDGGSLSFPDGMIGTFFLI